MGTFGFLKNKKDNGKHLKKKLPKVNYRELEGLTTNCTWKGEKFWESLIIYMKVEN